ncbi:MAG: hypothetical protein KDD64_17255 [Bdellovibrionales bacterium]|nr:hypothetical protein [Bdellovibrionales bacterium]
MKSSQSTQFIDQRGRQFELLTLTAPDPSACFADSPFLVPFDGSFNISKYSTKPPKGAPGERDSRSARKEICKGIGEFQDALYAEDKTGLTVALQGMDAAGKGGLIRRLTERITAGGCRVTPFKAPNDLELDQDFMRRLWPAVATRGMLAFLDRSHLEEVLVVRVHPEFLKGQRLPHLLKGEEIWNQRFKAIRDIEWHLAHQGFPMVKIWLHVSKEEQAKRLIDRAQESKKNYKYSERDISETMDHWDEYQFAAQEALRNLSTPWAPCYCIPADQKEFAALSVAEILYGTLKAIDPQYPSLSPEEAEGKKRLIERLRTRL